MRLGEQRVELEDLLRPSLVQLGVKCPVCIDGAHHRPPEDVGGPSGYEEFLEAWTDPNHDEHRAMRRWAGRGFDPEKFDIEATNKAILSALRKCRGGYRFRLEG